jgi:hypothetical protein
MPTIDPVIFRELAVIHKIIEDETWLEGERRGCWVSFDDPVVRGNVCNVVLRIGQQMRDSITETIAACPEQPRHAQKRADRTGRAA